MSSEDQTELTTIDTDRMNQQEKNIYFRRMRVLKNRFLPKSTVTPNGDTRLTNEEMADQENVSLPTIERDVAWLKKTYPSLWATDQVKSGFAYTMLEVSEMYSAMIKELFEKFWNTQDIDEQLKIATTLNNLIPTYTNSKSHGVILEKIKSTVKNEETN